MSHKKTIGTSRATTHTTRRDLQLLVPPQRLNPTKQGRPQIPAVRPPAGEHEQLARNRANRDRRDTPQRATTPPVEDPRTHTDLPFRKVRRQSGASDGTLCRGSRTSPSPGCTPSPSRSSAQARSLELSRFGLGLFNTLRLNDCAVFLKEEPEFAGRPQKLRVRARVAQRPDGRQGRVRRV